MKLQCPDCHSTIEPTPGQGSIGFCPACAHFVRGVQVAEEPTLKAAPVAVKPKLDVDQLVREALVEPNGGNGHKAELPDLPYRTSWTCADLLSADLPEPRWVVPGILPVGLAVLAGRPKSGKSWLALQLAVAVASGGRFFEVTLEQANVLYIALEDSPRRLQDRLRDLNVSRGLPIWFELEHPSLAEPDGVGALHARISRDGIALTVIDTLARACPGVKWADVEAVTPVIGGLQRLALATGTTILVLDHTRKPSAMQADPIDDLMGSTGKAAVIDTMLALYRRRGEAAATLRTTGRDIEERELSLAFQHGVGWVLQGDARDVAAAENEEAVLDALQSLGEADAGSLARELDKTRQAVLRVLKRLETRGLITCKTVVVGHTLKIVYCLA